MDFLLLIVPLFSPYYPSNPISSFHYIYFFSFILTFKFNADAVIVLINVQRQFIAIWNRNSQACLFPPPGTFSGQQVQILQLPPHLVILCDKEQILIHVIQGMQNGGVNPHGNRRVSGFHLPQGGALHEIYWQHPLKRRSGNTHKEHSRCG